MRTVLRLLIPVAIILALALPGCYTVIMHPSDEGGYQARQTSDCGRCHGAFHEYPYGYYYSPYPSWWWNHDAYSSYYAYPWWWRYYDYPYLGDDYQYRGTSANRGAKFDRRDSRSGPVPPPHSIGGSNPDLIWPGISTPGEYDRGQGGSNTQARPGSGTSNAGSESKDTSQGQSDSKGTRQSSGRAPTQTVQPDNSGGNDQPAEDKNTKKSRTKPRRDGGGGR